MSKKNKVLRIREEERRVKKMTIEFCYDKDDELSYYLRGMDNKIVSALTLVVENNRGWTFEIWNLADKPVKLFYSRGVYELVEQD